MTDFFGYMVHGTEQGRVLRILQEIARNEAFDGDVPVRYDAGMAQSPCSVEIRQSYKVESGMTRTMANHLNVRHERPRWLRRIYDLRLRTVHCHLILPVVYMHRPDDDTVTFTTQPKEG